MFIYVNVEKDYGHFEGRRVEISDDDLKKMIDRYFELKGIEIKEIGTLGV